MAWIGRTAIHEAFHTLPDGGGHSNQGNAKRYDRDKKVNSISLFDSIETDNMMLSGGAFPGGLDRFPREKRPLLFSFLWQDGNILRNFYSKGVPTDNFTKKIKK